MARRLGGDSYGLLVGLVLLRGGGQRGGRRLGFVGDVGGLVPQHVEFVPLAEVRVAGDIRRDALGPRSRLRVELHLPIVSALEVFEGVEQSPGVGVAVVGVFGRRRLDDFAEGGVFEPLGHRQRLLHVLEDRLGHRRAPDDPVAVEHLEDDQADRVDVGVGAGVGVEEEFGGHVVGRADQMARLRQGGLVTLEGLGDPEVEQFDVLGAAVATLDQEDVRRLHVPVDDPEVVGVGQPVGDLHGDVDGSPGGHRSILLDDLLEVRPLQQLHDQVDRPTVGLAGVE